MLRKSLLAILGLSVLALLSGCGPGEIGKDDVQQRAKAQADYAKNHPDPPGAGASG